MDSYNDKKSNDLINNFEKSIAPFFSKKKKFCMYQNSKIIIFESKKSFSDAYIIDKDKKKYLKQIDFNKWNLTSKNLNGDLIIMNTYSKFLKIFNNDKPIPFEEVNGFIKVLNKHVSEGEFKLVYYNSLHRFIFISHILIYILLFLILIIRAFLKKKHIMIF